MKLEPLHMVLAWRALAGSDGLYICKAWIDLSMTPVAVCPISALATSATDCSENVSLVCTKD